MIIFFKMESEGTPGKVMISEVTKNILERDHI